MEACPVKVLDHYSQTSVEKRPQLYVEDYFHAKNKHTRIIDWGMIRTDVAVWLGIFDDVCDLSETQHFFDQLGDHLTYFKAIPWQGHGSFMNVFEPVIEGMKTALDYPKERPFDFLE
jgi:hypothetical protein